MPLGTCVAIVTVIMIGVIAVLGGWVLRRVPVLLAAFVGYVPYIA